LRVLTRTLLFLGGASGSLVAAIVAVVAIVGLVDPVGSKLADDNDPFGPPEPIWHGVILLVVAGAIGTASVAALRSARIFGRSDPGPGTASHGSERS
jgi:hypothetical protein